MLRNIAFMSFLLNKFEALFFNIVIFAAIGETAFSDIFTAKFISI